MDGMKRIVALLFVSGLLVTCSEEKIEKGCGTMATVRDLSSLDGCGFVFELEDGARLEPIRVFFCGTPPIAKEQLEDPLYNFSFIDGKKVLIDWEPIEAVSICMAGQTVRITCLTEVESEDER
jgi:hypothetical protein